MKLALIVAVSDNDVIGRAGRLPWRLSADLRNFKRLTIGHPVIMGRKTYELMGKPLPGRTNIVLSRDPSYEAEGCIIAHSLNDAIRKAWRADKSFVIGGQKIFEEAIDKADELYITRVKAEVEGDTFFRFDPTSWKLTSSESCEADDDNQHPFEFQHWVRARATGRYLL